MTYTIDRVEYDQNKDQTIDEVKFRFTNNEEPFDTFWVNLTWRSYLEFVKENGLKHLFEERIQHQKETIITMDAIEKTFFNEAIGN